MTRRGFTLIEMLVVVGIIMILLGASITAFSKMTRTAEKTRAIELVKNVEVALTAIFQEKGVWPQRLIIGAQGDHRLDEEAAFALKDKMSLTVNNGQLAGLDKFGIVTPWATTAIKRAGRNAASADSIKVGSHTVKDHILYYALDLNGDGVIRNNEAPTIGGERVAIRATAAVWCVGKDGGDNGKPWPYSRGERMGDIYSWTAGQTQDAQ